MVKNTIAPIDAKSKSDRDAHVQTLRGLACLLVVAYHISSTDGTHAITIASDHPLSLFNIYLSPIRMPLFTFISGYVYALRPVAIGQEWSFLRGKFRRLLVPLVVVSSLYFLAQEFVPLTHFAKPLAESWRIFIFPYQHLWYLQALALIFGVVTLMERQHLLDRPHRWLCVLMASTLLHLFVNFSVDLFSIDEALYLMPFFTLGLGVRRFPDFLKNRALGVLFGVIAFIGLVIYHFIIAGYLNATTLETDTLRVLAISMPACIALFCFPFSFAPIAMLGGFSYSIYLFHILGTAGSRVILTHAGVGNTTVLLIVAMLAGLGLPILIQLIADRVKFAGTILLGRNPNRRLKSFAPWAYARGSSHTA